jgi:hypothetical protein
LFLCVGDAVTKAADFKISTVSRLCLAARKGGMKNPKIKIILPNGAQVEITEQTETAPAMAGDQAHQNPWDEVLTDAAHEKRPA